MKTWNLEDGLKLVRAIQQDCRRFNYHVTLGGGVLNDGINRKDLDLFFLPMGNSMSACKPKELLTWLSSMWGEAKMMPDYTREQQAPSPTISFHSTGDGFAYIMPSNASYSLGQIIPIVIQPPPIPEPTDNSMYRYKCKFFRHSSNDRIDVFIM